VGKISMTMSLMKASWQILKKDREILLLPVISGICCLSIMAIFITQALDHNWLKPLSGGATEHQKNIAYWFMFLFYYCNYLVIIFFNSAIIACAVIRMDGGNLTGDGLQAAVNRFPQIACWALIAATVGILLGMVESGSQRGRSILGAIFGIAWSVISYLAIPLIVVEKSNPLFALERSQDLMRRTWGEQVIGNFSFGLIFTLFALPVLPFIFILHKSWGPASFAVFYLYSHLPDQPRHVQSALQTIFNAVVRFCPRRQKVPKGSQPDK
jgi:hypothetical protein